MGETHFSGPLVSDTRVAHIVDAKANHSAAIDTDTAAHLKTALDNMAATVNAVIAAIEANGVAASS